MTKKKQKNQLDAFEIAMSLVAAPYAFIQERIDGQDAMKINGNTRVLTIPCTNSWSVVGLIHCFLKSRGGRFDHGVGKECYSHHNGELIGYTVTFW